MFNDGILLITGGTGSFGNAVLNKFLQTDLKEIRIFSRDEKKQTDMRIQYKNPKIKFIIGDIRNYESIYHATKGVDYIFHAAALKQVPSCEFYPLEAVKTNILGANNVINAAIENKVKKVIILSTDKAVYPINAMGISKAMMEKLTIAKSMEHKNTATILCCTRYGNVMTSRGSVIPLFIQQIQNNLPLTITDPSMTRFLMSLDDAVKLVMYAFQNAKQGDIFVHKASAATVHDLAIALKDILNAKNKIHIIGSRHGEKLHETLVTSEEMTRTEDLEGYYRIKADRRDLNYSKSTQQHSFILSDFNDYNSKNTKRLNIVEIKNLLLKLQLVK